MRNLKKILFVCVENSCRSQIAEGIARRIASDCFLAFSAGSKPLDNVNPDAIAVMNEIGIDISRVRPKSYKTLGERYFDYTVTLGCQDTCPYILAEKHIEWKIEDPKGRDRDFFRRIRDLLKEKILCLAGDIKREKDTD